MAERTLHLNLNLGAAGHPTAFIDPEYYAQTARIAERGLFDAIFLANISGLRAGVPGQGLDTIVTLTIIARATEKIGMIGTISTTLNHPYSIARWFASLEHVSKGRVGWNVVTTRNKNEGLNFGFDPLPDRLARYERATESIEVVIALWESWQEGAIVDVPGSPARFDNTKWAPIDHVGKHFSVAGPLQLPSYARTRPLLTQAGGSDEGTGVAARYVDAVFTPEIYLDTGQANYRKLKEQAAAGGRDPNTISVLPGLNPILESTDTAAKRRRAEQADLAADPTVKLREFAKWAGVEAAALDLDKPFPLEILRPSDPIFGSVGFDNAIREYLRHNQHRNVRELLTDGAGQGRGGGHRSLIGTPEQIADDMEAWFLGRAADGFIMGLNRGRGPGSLEDFIEQVVPLLQRKGIFRTEYREDTIRERFNAPTRVSVTSHATVE